MRTCHPISKKDTEAWFLFALVRIMHKEALRSMLTISRSDLSPPDSVSYFHVNSLCKGVRIFPRFLEKNATPGVPNLCANRSQIVELFVVLGQILYKRGPHRYHPSVDFSTKS